MEDRPCAREKAVNDETTDAAAALAQVRRLAPVCDRVEQQWQQGGRPRLEDELAAVAEGDRAALLGELLLLEWTYRRQRGEGANVAAYRDRFAGNADVVESAWGRWLEGSTAQDCASMSPETAVPQARPTQRPGEAVTADLAHLPSGYTNLEHLGEGGMGVVYRADDPRLGRKVALKRLNRLTPDLLERFRKEAMVLARLQHSNIVQVYHLDEMAGEPVIVMEYVAGGSLEELLRKGRLSSDQAAALVATLARAVGAAHRAGVVHRDLKPGNVLLSAACGLAGPGLSPKAIDEEDSATPQAARQALDVVPKVADFGLARVLDDAIGQTVSGAICGTPAYMAPEQALGKTSEVGPATDVWALGVILYRCLTGRLPFAGESMLDTLEKVKSCPPEPFRAIEGVPAELAAVCLACLNRDPRRRPTTDDLAVRLERFASAPEEAVPVQRRRWVWRSVAAAVGVLVLAGLTLVGVKMLHGPGDSDGPNGELIPPGITKGEKVGGGGAGQGARGDVAHLTIATFRVIHRRIVDNNGEKTTENHGEIGKDSFEPRFDDFVQVEVALSAPGYLYLLALNPNGKEQLLWPEDGRQAPAKVRELTWPPRRASSEEGGYCLNDEKGGGLQALAVVVAQEPLPAYEAWRGGRGPGAWQKMPGGKGVWLVDEKGVHPGRAGVGIVRGEVKALPGTGETAVQKRLRRVVQNLRKGGAETVEVLAFPVRAKEER
jgi:serine/threonine protein kinase